MAISIPHRFIDRLLPSEEKVQINIIIIGTFNPGSPKKRLLTQNQLKEFEKIESSEKYKKFNLVKNFYDRPQNRFWKIMDYVNNPEFYESGDFLMRNPKGLKYYKDMDREEVFNRQQEFCDKMNILITDIVREIQPDTFDDIYNNFPDTAIEASNCILNTAGIIDVINKNNPEKIIINFSPNERSMPKVTVQINKLRECFRNKFIIAPSTSGTAGFDYKYLINEWKNYM